MQLLTGGHIIYIHYIQKDEYRGAGPSDLGALTQFDSDATFRSKPAHVGDVTVLWAFVCHGCERGFHVLECVFIYFFNLL